MPAPIFENSPLQRMTLLLVVILFIVIAPFVVLRWATEQTLEASRLVTHTREVEAAAHALTYDVRNIEAAVLALAVGLDSAVIRARIADSNREIPQALERLTRLTRDNPEQQRRVGVLSANLDQRLQLSRRIGEIRDEAELSAAVTQLVLRFPIRNVTAEIVAAEQSLLQTRLQRAEALTNRVNALTWLSAGAQLLLLGLITYFSQRQISRRLVAEQASTRASARAQSVLQTVREPIVLIDTQQRVVLHNAAFSELYGVDEAGAQGLFLHEIGNGTWSDPAILQRLADVLLRNRELWDFEHVQRSNDGTERNILINARPMPLPDQDDHVALITVSDVTSQKAAAERVLDLNRQLEGKVEQVSEVNRELEAFSYSVSHDLRAPLRHVAGFADKLGRHLGEDADEKSRHYIDVIGSSARRMSTLIDDLLVYSRLGRSALRLQAVDMQSMVSETRALLDSNVALDSPNRRIEWRIAPLPIVIADDNMMRQVWLNLLGNAVKYSANRDKALIEVGHKRLDDGSHEFTVGDNGAGFDMAYAGKLFGVFQRMHKASDFPGTGIGLASVRRVLVRHGGQIHAEAELDVGATFRFVLPANLENTRRESAA